MFIAKKLDATSEAQSGFGMFVAKKQDTTLEAQSGAFYAPENPISQQVPPGNGIARNHLET